MRPFVCFGGGGSAAVADDDAAAGDIQAAVVAARHRRHQSFRGKFLSATSRKGKTTTNKPSSPPAESKKPGLDAATAAAADAHGLTRASKASPVPSSPALMSSAPSLDSDYSSSSRSSSVSSSSSDSGAPLPSPPPAPGTKRQVPTTASPAAGAAAVVLCLLTVVLCGRLGATVLMSTALYLFPRRWPAARSARNEGGVDSMECDAEGTAKRKVVTEGFLVRNRKH